MDNQAAQAQNDEKAPLQRNDEGTAPGEAGDTPNDSVIEDPRDVADGAGSPQDAAPTRSS